MKNTFIGRDRISAVRIKVASSALVSGECLDFENKFIKVFNVTPNDLKNRYLYIEYQIKKADFDDYIFVRDAVVAGGAIVLTKEEALEMNEQNGSKETKVPTMQAPSEKPIAKRRKAVRKVRKPDTESGEV